MNRKDIIITTILLLTINLFTFGQATDNDIDSTNPHVLHANIISETTTGGTDSIPIVEKKPNFIKRIVNYYSGSNIDKTFVKKMDWSIAPGPNYSSDIGLGLGFLIAGLYRPDQTDSITSPSNIRFYGNITTEKFMMARVMGDNFLQNDKYILSYSGSFVYFPGAFYGVGYNDGKSGYVQSLTNTMAIVKASGAVAVLPNTYLGASISFNYTGAESRSKYPSEDDIEKMKDSYNNNTLDGDLRHLYELYMENKFDPSLSNPFDNYIAYTGEDPNALNSSVGIFAQYDTRDVITAPHKGIYSKLEARYFPKFLGNSQNSFTKVNFTFNFFQKLWEGTVLAYDLHSEFTFNQPSWHMYSKIGGTDRMRGYYEGRFRDNNIMTTQLELRQKIYRRHGVVGWIGAGNAWGHDKFRWSNTLQSFGVGYRFEFKNRMNIRIDYGWGAYGNPNFNWDNKRSSAFIFTASEAF